MKTRYIHISTEHVVSAIEQYLKSMSLINDDDYISDFEEHFDGLMIRLRKENDE